MTEPDPVSDPRKALLTQTISVLEDLLLSGTTTASTATLRRLNLTLEQLAEARLLRLAAALRIVIEELKRIQGDPERFSASRYGLFVDRCWLLAGGTLRALAQNDQAALVRLTAPTRGHPLKELSVAVAGVLKRHVPGAFSAFEFRLRLLQAATLAPDRVLPVGTPLVWSLVVPAAAGHQFPAEAFLSMRQKQGFSPAQLLNHKSLQFSDCSLLDGEPLRVQLGPDSRLLEIEAATPDWRSLLAWDPNDWQRRIHSHRPDPLELPVELAQDVLLEDWQIDPFAASTVPGRENSERCARLQALGCSWRVRVDQGELALEQALQTAASRSPQPALYASAHVELGEQVLSPLALLGEKPEYITIGKPEFDRVALVRMLNSR